MMRHGFAAAAFAAAAFPVFAEIVFEGASPSADMTPRMTQIVDMPSSATNWLGQAWLSFDVVNFDDAGGVLRVVIEEDNKNVRAFELPVSGSRKCVASFGQFFLKRASDIRRIRFSVEDGPARRFAVTRVERGKKDEPRPKDDPPPMPRESAAHEAALKAFLTKCESAGSVANGMAIGIAPSVAAVRPRGDFRAEAATNAFFSLARNEYESLQVVVTPRGNKPLRGVTVTVEGEFATNIAASVMGYVHVAEPAGYKARDLDGKVRWPERTWYPDPILDFKKTADIEPRDVQSFWLRVKCPAQQPAGLYAGTVRVSDANGATYSFPLKIRVRDFSLPLTPPLDMAMCFNPRYFESGAKQLYDDPATPINVWKRHKVEWCDFLAEYFITMDNIYSWDAPDWEIIERLRDKGRLGRFNIGYWSGGSKGEWFKGRADKARSLGVFEHAYSYGCDELKPKNWQAIAKGAASIKAVEPELPLLTTTRDDSYGAASPLTNVVFVQNLEFWNPAAVAKAQKGGRSIWWYICSDPKAPRPNVFVECPPIETRLLMGAMAQKFCPDGFLYYALALWRSPRTILDGPFTDWIARNREWYHGDGCLTYCGPDGTPIASQHLENLRDGLEDLWYAKLLAEKLRDVESSKAKCGGEEWIRRTKAALAVPRDIVDSTSKFTVAPDVLRRWRDEMADLIEEAGRAPMNTSGNNALGTVYSALASEARELYDTIFAPVVVGTPPTYAVRDLCVTSDGEIRHYGWREINGRRARVFAASRDLGLNWETRFASSGDIGACVRSPWSGDWITLFTSEAKESKGVLCSARSATGPGDPSPETATLPWARLELRQLIPLRHRQRWVATVTVSCPNCRFSAAVLLSDDDGRTWRKIDIAPVPDVARLSPGDLSPRWFSNGCEPAVAELSDGSLLLALRTSGPLAAFCRSEDGGETWSVPKPRDGFWQCTTMPGFLRLSDGRLLFFWNNTAHLPTRDISEYPELTVGERNGVWGAVFTNRDALHAAISDDDGRTWRGFREIALNESRNATDFRELGNGVFDEADKSVHQTQALELPGGKVLVAYGQNPAARHLAIFDPDWLLETSRSEDFRHGLGNVSQHLYVRSLSGGYRGWAGHCAWNRVPGAVMSREPDAPEGRWIRESMLLAHIRDPRLVCDVAGAVWNFPATRVGRVSVECRIEGAGFRLSLFDHWINPCDVFNAKCATFTAPIDAGIAGKGWHNVEVEWNCEAATAKLLVDGRVVRDVALGNVPPFGFSYLHLQAADEQPDPNGTYFRSFSAQTCQQ